MALVAAIFYCGMEDVDGVLVLEGAKGTIY